eukprot:144184_1
MTSLGSLLSVDLSGTFPDFIADKFIRYQLRFDCIILSSWYAVHSFIEFRRIHQHLTYQIKNHCELKKLNIKLGYFPKSIKIRNNRDKLTKLPKTEEIKRQNALQKYLEILFNLYPPDLCFDEMIMDFLNISKPSQTILKNEII